MSAVEVKYLPFEVHIAAAAEVVKWFGHPIGTFGVKTLSVVLYR